MLHPLSTCLWFNNNALEGAEFYEQVFPEFKWISKNPMAVNYTILGHKFMNLNGGPGFPINPSISFFIQLTDEKLLEETWHKLMEGGMIMMDYNTYPWSKKYGWGSDKFGVSWQLMLVEGENSLVPSFMFVQENVGKAEEAMDFYASIFPNSASLAKARYEKGEQDVEGYLKFSRTQLNGTIFGAMDSSMKHLFSFSEGVSFVIVVDTQDEIDFYWDKLVAGGKEGKCGWLKDKYGVSWQIVPSILPSLMNNPETAPKTMYNFMQMTKFIIEKL